MRVAVPMKNQKFCAHFGRCDELMLAEVDMAARRIDQPRTLARQSNGCDALPEWLHALGVEHVVVGGIGGGAIGGLQHRGIEVSFGYLGRTAMDVLEQFMAEPDRSGPNPCHDHDHPNKHHHCHDHDD